MLIEAGLSGLGLVGVRISDESPGARTKVWAQVLRRDLRRHQFRLGSADRVQLGWIGDRAGVGREVGPCSAGAVNISVTSVFRLGLVAQLVRAHA